MDGSLDKLGHLVHSISCIARHSSSLIAYRLPAHLLTCNDPSHDHIRSMLLSAVFLWLSVASTATATGAEAFSSWGLPLALFRHISQLEGGSSWLSRLGWGLGEAEVSIVVSIRIVAPGPWSAYFTRYVLYLMLRCCNLVLVFCAGGPPDSCAAKIPYPCFLQGPGRPTGIHWNNLFDSSLAIPLDRLKAVLAFPSWCTLSPKGRVRDSEYVVLRRTECAHYRLPLRDDVAVIPLSHSRTNTLFSTWLTTVIGPRSNHHTSSSHSLLWHSNPKGWSCRLHHPSIFVHTSLR